MNADITLLRLNDAVKKIEGTFKNELIEMARFQPVRFYDFRQHLQTVMTTPIPEEEMTDNQYDMLTIASLIQRILSGIPERKLKPKPISDE